MLVNNSSLQPSRRAAVRERQWRTAAQSGLTRLLRICSERSASRSSRRNPATVAGAIAGKVR